MYVYIQLLGYYNRDRLIELIIRAIFSHYI